MPSTISFRLCGAMFVAIPTAIPDEPFTRRFGNTDGRTSGSFRLASKLGTKSTVFFSISFSMYSAIFESLASVYLMAAALSPSTLPKFPCPSMSGYLRENSCAILTSASYTALSPWGWYLPRTSPTILALFL